MNAEGAPGAATPTAATPGVAPAEVQLIVDALDDRRAKDITVLDLRDVSESLDFFVIATAESTLQIKSMEETVRERMKAASYAINGVEGPSDRWVLIDYGAVVVHLMSTEARDFYDLDGLWADAARLQVTPN